MRPAGVRYAVFDQVGSVSRWSFGRGPFVPDSKTEAGLAQPGAVLTDSDTRRPARCIKIGLRAVSVRWYVTRASMALQVSRLERVEARGADPTSGRRVGIGLLAGVAPHLGLTTLVVLSYADSDSDEGREFAIMPVLLETFLIPVALALVLALAVTKRTRSWAKGLFGGTGLGLVVVAMLLVWHRGSGGG